MSETKDRLAKYLEISVKSMAWEAANELSDHHRKQYEFHKKRADYHKGFSETTPSSEDRKKHLKIAAHHKAEAEHHAKSYNKASKLG